MARLPTPEEMGKLILSIYGQFNVRPGEMLLIQNILAKWIKTGYRNEDMFNGLEWLGEKGFVEQKEGSSDTAIFLTESGFAEI